MDKDLRSLHEILDEDYPEIAQLWAEAVNADFESIYLEDAGKTEEAKKMREIHNTKWAEYKLAVKLVLGVEYKY